MSFLGDLIGSIGGERPPAPPLQSIKPPQRPASNPPPQSTVSKSAPSTTSTARPVYKGTAGLGAQQQIGSLKRKAEEISSERPVKLPKSSLQSTSDREAQKPLKPGANDSTPSTLSKPQPESSSQAAQNASKPPTKPPARGSYAALMARAKDAQSSKGPSSIGLIKHQSTEKDKIKTSKLAERKRQHEQDKDKDKDKGRASAGPTSKLGANGKVDPRRRSVSPVKKADLPKVPRAPKPPLHGPPRKEAAPAYRGTMGQAPKKSKDDVRTKSRSRYDEYLDTDEEDEDQYGYDDEPDYYSDASSDMMDAGFDDMDMEEREAARIAREEDARELALENQLKKEKEERKRKLAAMAKKHSK